MNLAAGQCDLNHRLYHAVTFTVHVSHTCEVAVFLLTFRAVLEMNLRKQYAFNKFFHEC